jgi:hypothetical protein
MPVDWLRLLAYFVAAIFLMMKQEERQEEQGARFVCRRLRPCDPLLCLLEDSFLDSLLVIRRCFRREWPAVIGWRKMLTNGSIFEISCTSNRCSNTWKIIVVIINLRSLKTSSCACTKMTGVEGQNGWHDQRWSDRMTLLTVSEDWGFRLGKCDFRSFVFSPRMNENGSASSYNSTTWHQRKLYYSS